MAHFAKKKLTTGWIGVSHGQGEAPYHREHGRVKVRALLLSLAVAACGPTIGDPCTTAQDCLGRTCLNGGGSAGRVLLGIVHAGRHERRARPARCAFARRIDNGTRRVLLRMCNSTRDCRAGLQVRDRARVGLDGVHRPQRAVKTIRGEGFEVAGAPTPTGERHRQPVSVHARGPGRAATARCRSRSRAHATDKQPMVGELRDIIAAMAEKNQLGAPIDSLVLRPRGAARRRVRPTTRARTSSACGACPTATSFALATYVCRLGQRGASRPRRATQSCGRVRFSMAGVA